MPEATTQPIQEDIKFLVGYSNVYVNRTTGVLEMGARCYRSPAAADARRISHPCRDEIAFVGVFAISAVVPDAVRLATLAANAPSVAPTPTPDDEDGLENPDDSDQER